MEQNDLFINSVSFSQISKFTTNTGEWQNNRILGIYDNTSGVSSAVGTILHKFVEKYLKDGIMQDAIDTAFKCIYDGEDGLTYIIDPDAEDFNKGITLEKVKEQFKTKVINFGKTGSNEKIIKDVKAGIQSFLSEAIDYGELIGVEYEMEHQASDILGGNIKVQAPIPFKAISDEICRNTRERDILIGGELLNVPSGKIFIEDTKFKSKHTEMNEEDPKYIFQAFFNYYCVLAEFGEAPAFMTFREIKLSKNKDGSSQHQTITIPFFGEIFETYKVFFWRYITETFERMKLIQERDFLFNIFDFTYGAKEWEKQKAYYLDVPVGTLKNKMGMTQKRKVASNRPVMGDRNPIKGQKVSEGITSEDLFTIDNKIRIAFQNFGIIINFEKKVEGFAFDQYQFSTARGTKMSEVKKLLPEIFQALEIKKGLRIEAPLKGTKFIGVEIPREERKFANINDFKYKKVKNTPILPIGININGEVETIDMSDSDTPHLIVAGQSGSGKSEFLKTAIETLKDYGETIIIDPKKVGLLKMKKYTELYLTDLEIIANYLDKLKDLMLLEYEVLAELGYESINEYFEEKPKGKRFKHKFLYIDELASLSNAIQQIEGIDKNGNRTIETHKIGEKIIMPAIEQLVNLGRAVGIHLILATQRPDVKVLPGNIKANLSARVCFALATETDSKVVIDEIGAEELLGKGDMLFMNRGIERLQGFYIGQNAKVK